jgi:hypothetical protein
MGLGAQYGENAFRYHSGESRAVAASLPEGVRDWFAITITNSTAFSITQEIPLGGAFFDTPADDPRSPRLLLEAVGTNTNVYGIYGTSNKQNRFVNTFLWTLGAELAMPVAEYGGHLWAFSPYFRYNNMHDDGNTALSRDKVFYRAGARLTRVETTNPFAGDGAEGDALLAAGKSAAARPPSVTLDISAFWGEAISGVQTSVSWTF